MEQGKKKTKCKFIKPIRAIRLRGQDNEYLYLPHLICVIIISEDNKAETYLEQQNNTKKLLDENNP